ncbi:hypothetical protein ACH5RR_036665 [Cinchona calisaya]|uniref:Secreted protein n=1 Tax=Cinchona calisaya TaxID=153742 RepID=A0ABD2Y5A7_9GENT
MCIVVPVSALMIASKLPNMRPHAKALGEASVKPWAVPASILEIRFLRVGVAVERSFFAEVKLNRRFLEPIATACSCSSIDCHHEPWIQTQ